MIIKSDVGHLPASLQDQFSTGVGRNHQLWRIVQQGVTSAQLEDRIEFYACTGLRSSSSRKFRVTLDDADPLAVKINELAKHHRLSNSFLFEILVTIGWNHLNAFAESIGAGQPARTEPAKTVNKPITVQNQPAAVATSTMPEEVQATPQEPQESLDETPEFKEMTRSMLASFGIDIGLSPTNGENSSNSEQLGATAP